MCEHLTSFGNNKGKLIKSLGLQSKTVTDYVFKADNIFFGRNLKENKV